MVVCGGVHRRESRWVVAKRGKEKNLSESKVRRERERNYKVVWVWGWKRWRQATVYKTCNKYL